VSSACQCCCAFHSDSKTDFVIWFSLYKYTKYLKQVMMFSYSSLVSPGDSRNSTFIYTTTTCFQIPTYHHSSSCFHLIQYHIGQTSTVDIKVKVKVKLSLCLIKYNAMEKYWGAEVQLHALTSTLDGGEWWASRPAPLNPEKSSGNHWIRVWEAPRAGVDEVGKRNVLAPWREWNPGRPARRLITIQTELRWLPLSHVVFGSTTHSVNMQRYLLCHVDRRAIMNVWSRSQIVTLAAQFLWSI
jgi:hypothetical protein